MSFEEVQNLNKRKSILLLDGLKAVEAEQALLNLKIANNHLLLNSKKHSTKFDDLRKDLVKIYQKFGIKNVTIAPAFTNIANIKDTFEGMFGKKVQKKKVSKNNKFNNKLKKGGKKRWQKM